MPTELKPTFQAKSNTAANNTATCCRKTFIAMQIIKNLYCIVTAENHVDHLKKFRYNTGVWQMVGRTDTGASQILLDKHAVRMCLAL